MWDPGQYLSFGHERSRPFFDLINRIGAERAERVVDLGCGPGQLTPALTARWPTARVLGLDSSPEMIHAAGTHAANSGDMRVEFLQADLCHWQPAEPIDVIVSNAVLQWVPHHVGLLGRFVSWLAPDGWLAFQVPGNFRSPTHRILTELRQSDRWRAKVGEGAERHLAVLDPVGYAQELLDLDVGLSVDAWETTYLHLLTGKDPVLEWVKGTGLRPVLAALHEREQEEFLALYGERLLEAYPPLDNGLTPLPFRRIFVVAHLTPG
jgi:trans-aconitate 2-methyltransferase